MARSIRNNFFIFLTAALGMICGHLVVRYWDVLPFANAQGSASLSAKSLEITGPNGKRKIFMTTMPSGAPTVWFYDDKGVPRLNLGLYDDGNSFIVLNDDKSLATEIFRTVGPSNAPVVVMKSQGQDRMVMGLGFNDAEPFLVHYDKKGAKTNVFGKF